MERRPLPPARRGRRTPPLTVRAALLSAALLTAVLAAVVLTVVHLPGPFDERTLADQRNGLLHRGDRDEAVPAADVLGLPPAPAVDVRVIDATHQLRFDQPQAVAAVLSSRV